MSAGPALATGPGEDASGFNPPGMSGLMYTHGSSRRGWQVSVPKLDNKTECFSWKQRLIAAAKAVELDGQFLGNSERLVPVGDMERSKADFMREGYREVEIVRGLNAMNFLTSALVNPADLAIQSKSLTARQALDEICQMHEPSTQGAKLDLFERFLVFKVPREEEPFRALLSLEQLADRLRSLGVPLDPKLVLLLFVRGLPEEYEHSKYTLAGQESMERDDVLRRVNTQFNSLHQKRLSASEQAYFAAAPGQQHGKRKKGKSGGRNGGGSNGDGNGGGRSKERCFKCGRPGHRYTACETPPEKCLHQCELCSGYGHKESACPSAEKPTEEAGLAIVQYESDDSVTNQAY